MKRTSIQTLRFFVYAISLLGLLSANYMQAQTIDSLKYPFKKQSGGLYLESPMGYYAQYDPETGNYILRQKIGSLVYGAPIILTRDQYMNMLLKQSMGEYYKQKSQAADGNFRSQRYGTEESLENKGLVLPSISVKNKLFQDIFGGDKIELIPRGYASLDLGVYYQKLDNPEILPQNRSSFAIDLQQRIQLGILGRIGKNLELGVNYDTQAGFGFENRMNLGWKPNSKGGEDNIIQNIEFGNVSLPLSTSIITGVQSLFGAKTELKFGNTYITSVFSQQESEARTITVQDGGAVKNFKIYAKDYDVNQHYFLSQFFRNHYDEALASYPFISSQINITRLEVWVINKGNTNPENRRTIIAFRDLGEQGENLPNNGRLYNRITAVPELRSVNDPESTISALGLKDVKNQPYIQGEQYLVHQNVRKLSSSEYEYFPSLGYLSLHQPLNDNELLAVSFQYTLTTQPGKLFSVGEFSDEQSALLVTKLIKSSTRVTPESPMWDLMMKNIYSLEAYQLSPEDFRLQVLYQDPDLGTSGLNYLQGTKAEDKTLLQALNMDRLDMNGQAQKVEHHSGDGIFDFVEGITIDTKNAKIKFTTVEPFAKTIEKAIGENNPKYVLRQMYKDLPINFEQNAAGRRYYLEGHYKSEGDGGISLGAFNIPQGAVKVTANGKILQEGVDYTVDYQLGKVNIINESIKNSGIPINVSLENRATFNMQTKRLIGVNVQHKFSDALSVGATYMNYKERLPGSLQKAQYNAEPVSNSIFGANVQYNTTSTFLTRLTDRIPMVDTDAPSNISFMAEGAYLMPGINKASENQSYIDDFENAQSKISLTDVNTWHLASTPLITDTEENPEFSYQYNPEDYSFNYNRRLISWYIIDPRFYGIGGKSPMSKSEIANQASRRVLTRELFSGRDVIAGTPDYINTFDITYYPQERGPYNLNPDWKNEQDKNKWAGITRALNITNLKQANIEYIEFWLMDPYLDSKGDDPEAKLLLHLGSVSEDILRDGKMLYENGINQANNPTENTHWGEAPKEYPILYSFQTEGAEREKQDVGYNGLSNEQERTMAGYKAFSTEINPITQEVDPAGDDFVYYLDARWNSNNGGSFLPNRYKYFRNPQGNSKTGTQEIATNTPDAEDANGDYNLDRTENYNQYTIPLGKKDLSLRNKFIVDVKETQAKLEDGQIVPSKWYLFRIPLDEYDKGVAAHTDNILTAARYMRLIMKGFSQQTTLRFGTFDMVRSDWQRYQKNLYPNINSPEGQQTIDLNNLSIGTVNVEENRTANPPYVLPPGIQREQLQTTAGAQSQNEASMVLNITRLKAEDARAVFKNTNLDLRRFNSIKMFTHAHTLNIADETDNLKLFLRLGSDLVENYYEYEIPLKYTSPSAVTPQEIWPIENRLEVAIDELVKAKEEAYQRGASGRYTKKLENGKAIYVKGRPSLGNVSTLAIGVRNNLKQEIRNAIVWINELRLSGVSNEGGYAATAMLNFNLGDLAQVNASGTITTVGFGALDRGPVERQQEEVKSYAINTTLNMDKFLPKKWRLKIPFNYAIHEEFINPKYNPLDNDVILKNSPQQAEIEGIVGVYRKKLSYGFSNIRKERSNQQRPARFYDIENFSLSGNYHVNYFRDIYTAYNLRQDLNASLNYNYQFQAKYHQPFKDWYMVKDTAKSAKYLQWIKAFNLNPRPSRLSFRTDIVRTYNEQQYRDINSYLFAGTSPTNFRSNFGNNFLFNWQYNVGFDLTKSLRIDYTAATRTLAKKMQEVPDQNLIFKDLFSIGRPINYNHQLQINWKVPIHLFPYMEWIDIETGYTATYDWQAILSNNATIAGQGQDLGNLAQNAQTLKVVGDIDFSRLYSQFAFIEKVNQKQLKRRNELDSIKNIYTEITKSPLRKNRLKNSKFHAKTRLSFKDYAVLALQSIKRGQINYSKVSGIVLPGVLAEPNFIGIGKERRGPNASFIFGSQSDFRRMAVENGWVTQSEYLTQPYTKNMLEDFSANLQLEPIPSLIIDLNARRNYNKNMMQSGFNILSQIQNNTPSYGFENAYENTQENLTLSVVSVGASAESKDKLYKKLKDYAQQLSLQKGNLLGLKDADGDGYAQGYGLANAEVLLPAFLSAYQGKKAPRAEFSFKKGIPLPNWNITYTGLSNTPWIAKYFEQLNLTHNYTATQTLSGIQSNLNKYTHPTTLQGGRVVIDAQGNPTTGIDGNLNLYTENTYGAVTLLESFSPLIGVDATLRNNMQFRAQYNRDRMVSLSLSNYTLTEDYGNEFILGLGYIIKNVSFKMRYMGKRKIIKGDLNIRADVAIRDNELTIRRILTDDLQISGGQKIFSLKFNAQYLFSKNFNVSLFYDQMITKYKITTAYPLSTLRAGISATVMLGQ